MRSDSASDQSSDREKEIATSAQIEALSLDEKTSLLHGAPDPKSKAGAGYLPGIPRLNIPPLRLTDGPAGIRTSSPATALPSPIALAASFDPKLARRFGEVLGREGRAHDQDVVLAPMVNIVRVPEAGRNFETLGEDPLLASELVGPEVRGIQSQHLIATVKHYVANNFEENRTSVSVEIGDRALREIYLPGFRAAVEAGVGSVMCAYNRINGVHACENRTLLTDILKKEFGFEGWVMSDWFACHSTGAIRAGLDLEMPGTSGIGEEEHVHLGDALQEAVEEGRVSEKEVDAAVGRILRQMRRMQLPEQSSPSSPDVPSGFGETVARDVAESGAVLLKNEHNLLPLTDDVQSIAVIGPTAERPLYGGGGSARVPPHGLERPLDELQRRTKARVHYAAGLDFDGVPVPRTWLSPSGQDEEGGLRRRACPGAGKVDSTINFTGEDALPAGSTRRWTGILTAPESGIYELKLQTKGGKGKLTFGDQEQITTGGVLNDESQIPTASGLTCATVAMSLDAGESYSLSIEAESGAQNPGETEASPLQVRLAWVSPSRRQSFIGKAIDTAREADVVLVFAYDEGSEGRDRSSLSLDGRQDLLIEKISTLDARSAIVLNTGGPVLMPWISEIDAALQAWYPGQKGAEATAALLTGAANPSGRLPITFPRRPEDAPTHSTERYPGREKRVAYSEGVFVGYRWYDRNGIAPLFPFGHGLSYTDFSYSNLSVRGSSSYEVQFQIQNVGDRRGVAVPQVYVGPPEDPPLPMPPKQLAGFDRVRLAPQKRATVTIPLAEQALSYWSEKDGEWRMPAGPRPVYVGSSSRRIRLETTLNAP